MRVLNLIAENFKKLRVVDITPVGNLVQITGQNTHGKTSCLDAIWSALGGGNAQPSKPVREGATKGQIKVTLGDGKPELIVTRKFTAAGSTSLIVEQADGSLLRSPQKVLDDLLGALTFDPLEFTRMKPADQLDTLRGMVKLDVDVDALDKSNEADFAKRTEVNRRVKSLEAQASAISVPSGLPAQPVDTSSLLGDMERASAHNSGIEKLRATHQATKMVADNKREQAKRAREDAAKLREQAAAKDEEAVRHDAEAADHDKSLADSAKLPEPIDPAKLRQKIEEAKAVNAGIDIRTRRQDLLRQRDEADKEATALTAAMEKRTSQKTEAIAKAAMPVAGLGFGAGEVLFNGVPFAQASSAEQLRVSVGIAMAANPRLKVLRITDGSLLDDKSMGLLAEMLKAGDYQCWLEKVDSSGKVGIVIVDGEVAADNQEAAQEHAA